MAKAYRNSNAELNAISDKISAINSLGSARQQSIQQEGNSKQNAIKRQSIDLASQHVDTQFTYEMLNHGLDLANTIIKFGSEIDAQIKGTQQAKADARNVQRLQEGTRIFNEGLQSGDIYWGDDGNGNSQLVISPELQEWHDNAIAEIEGTKQMSSVRQIELDGFSQTYSNLIQKGYSTALQKSYADRNQAFSLNLDSYKKQDVQSFLRADGSMDEWIGRGESAGIASIYNRTDWSPERRQAEINSYVQDVAQQGSIEAASMIALTQGNKAAFDYLYGEGSTGMAYLTENQRQSAYSMAVRANSNRASAVAEEMERYMEQAILSNANAGEDGPEPIANAYKEIYRAIENESPEVRKQALQASKAKHAEIVTSACAQRLAYDTDSGLAALIDSYDMITSGSLDDLYFMGIPDVKTSVMKSYQNAISTAQKNLSASTGTNADDIEKSNKAVVASYEKAQKTALSLFDSGAIKGSQLVEMYLNNAEAFTARLAGTSDEMTMPALQMLAVGNAYLDDIINSYIPTKYQDIVQKKATTIKQDYKDLYGGTDSNASAQLADTLQFYNGYIADWCYENGASATADEISAMLDSLAQSMALSFADDNWAEITQNGGKTIGASNAKAAMKQFKSLNARMWDSDTSSYLVYDENAKYDIRDNPYGDPDGTGIQYRFISQDTRNTFDSISDYAATQISYLTGDDYERIRATARVGRDDDGRMILSPIMQDSDGTWYRIKYDTIQRYSLDDEKWESIVEIQRTEKDMQKALEKSKDKG